jgi:hypothetical protein
MASERWLHKPLWLPGAALCYDGGWLLAETFHNFGSFNWWLFYAETVALVWLRLFMADRAHRRRAGR